MKNALKQEDQEKPQRQSKKALEVKRIELYDRTLFIKTTNAIMQYIKAIPQVSVGEIVEAIFPKTKRSISSGAAPVGSIQGDTSISAFRVAVIMPQNNIGAPQEDARCWSLSCMPSATEINATGIVVKSKRRAVSPARPRSRVIPNAQMKETSSQTKMHPITFPAAMVARLTPDERSVCSAPRSRSSAKMHTVPIPPILLTAS